MYATGRQDKASSKEKTLGFLRLVKSRKTTETQEAHIVAHPIYKTRKHEGQAAGRGS
jgi:hypothetical protein